VKRKVLFISIALLALLVLLAFLGGWRAAPAVQARWATWRQPLPPLAEARYWLAQEFYGPLPPSETLTRGAIRGLLETLGDRYTILVDPQPAQQEKQRLAGRYGDVGVTLWWFPGGGIGLSPTPGGPATALQEGDQLLAVNGTDVTAARTLDEVAWQLVGEVGTPVTLTVLRPPTLTVTLVRAEVLHPSVQARVLDQAAGIGYIGVSLFTELTPEELQAAVTGLQAAGAQQALVLDLRNNGGGVIAPLPRIGALFLPPGTPLYRVTERGNEETVTAADLDRPPFTGPLVVLVNGGTASAAEILAAALHEHGRAALVGRQTFGKGSIQALYPLRDGSTLHITTAIWLTPGGQPLDGVGLEPDQTVEEQPGRDAVLEAALRRLLR